MSDGGVKLSPGQRTFVRTLSDRAGAAVTVRVVIDEGAALDRVIRRLANKLRRAPGCPTFRAGLNY